MQRKSSKGDLLNKAINELYKNQASFHASMQQFCAAFTEDVCALLKPKDRDILDKFLKPYRQLIQNPFIIEDQRQPTLGNIASIISEANKEFNQVWGALSVCNEQFASFNGFLVVMETKNPKFTAALNENLRATSNTALAIGAYTVKPVQHSMRYKLTLTEINKHVESQVAADLIALLESSTLRMNYHMYTREIILELEAMRNKSNSFRRTSSPIASYINNILGSAYLTPNSGLSSDDARLHFIQVLCFLHKRLVELSFIASDIGSLSLFRRYHNPMLSTLKALTKKVEQRYLSEVGVEPRRLLMMR